jgi:sigma-B regulation protein RsbU (phosphoserine phosphatase)
MRDFVDSERPQSLEQMEPILETLNDGVVIADDSDQILFVNAVFEEMTGIARNEIIGHDLRQLYHRADEFALAQAFSRKALEMGRSREEFFLPMKGGGRLPVVASVRVMRGPEGGRLAVVTLTDISKQKHTEEKLRAANARLAESQRKIERDLVVAARVQQSLAPKPIQWAGCRVDTFYQPAHRIGGDFGLITPFKQEHLNLLVCDVSGHGISSALAANRIYAETITLLGNRLPLADMLRQLNSLGIQNIGAPGFFFTLAAARIDRSRRTMEFAGAGHPPAMIVHPGAEPRLLPSRSMILGTLPDAVGADATLLAEIEPEDRIVLYTDGLTDVFDSRGEMLRVDGVRNIVRETALLPFSEMKQGILDRVARWRDGPAVDDMSLVLVDVR